MKYNRTHLLYLLIVFSLLTGCRDLTDQEIYKRPGWLPGKLYTTVTVQGNLAMFAECLRLAGLDKILDVSGSWSVFAPTDEAMKKFLAEKGYSKISDIPPGELEKIAEFHVIQNPWSLEQLKILGAYGWRTGNDLKSTSYAYKRETMLKNPMEKYWIKRSNKKEMVVMDSTISEAYKMVFVQSRKYVPIFYDEYFTVNNIPTADYTYYFNRVFEKGNVYYAGAKILKSDILAENGFVHVIDKVVEPMLNAKEMLLKERPGESYKLFLELVYWYYPSFEPNISATYSQSAVRTGGYIDTIWDLNFSSLAFNLQDERIIDINQTLVRHNGLFAPTDEPFRKFIDGLLTSKSGYPHWYDYKALPADVAAMIVTPHLKSTPFYPSSNIFQDVFRKDGRFRQNEQSIIRKEFGSNCTFIGLNSYTPDRAFTSVTGPVFCRPSYSIFRRALQFTGALNTIANHKGPLYFFPIPDYSLQADSSLLLNWINQDRNLYNFMVYNRSNYQMENINSSTLNNWLLNQVGTSVSRQGDIEIIRTLRGNNLTWDHSKNTIRGTYPSTVGYKGKETAICYPVQLEEPVENGKTLTVSYWFNFTN